MEPSEQDLVPIDLPVTTYERLVQAAQSRGQTVNEWLAAELDRIDDVFWQGYRDQLDALRADPVAWAEMQAELAELDATLLDGLHDEPWDEPPGSPPTVKSPAADPAHDDDPKRA